MLSSLGMVSYIESSSLYFTLILKKSYFLQVKQIAKLSQGDFFNSNLMK